jgi:hypothetical protein
VQDHSQDKQTNDSHGIILPPNRRQSYLIRRQKKISIFLPDGLLNRTFDKINEHGFLLNWDDRKDAVFFIPLIYECSGRTGQNFPGRLHI